MESNQNNKITTKTAEMFLRGDSILVVRFLEGIGDIDLEEIKAQIDAGMKLTGGKRAPVLVDARASFHSLSPEAKIFAAENKLKIAEAILVKSLHQRIIGTFFLRLASSVAKHPTKIFSEETEALNWLSSFTEK